MEKRVRIVGGKCGCAYCRDGVEPMSRNAWMSRKNRYNRSFGSGKGSAKGSAPKARRS